MRIVQHSLETIQKGSRARLSVYHADGDQREFDLKTRVITNENIIIPKMFHSCALNK